MKREDRPCVLSLARRSTDLSIARLHRCVAAIAASSGIRSSYSALRPSYQSRSAVAWTRPSSTGTQVQVLPGLCIFSPGRDGLDGQLQNGPHMPKAQADRAGGASITADNRDDIISGSMVPPATPMLLPIPLSHGAFTWSQPSRMRTRITSHRRVSVRADKTQQTAPKAGQTLIACGATLYSHRVLPDLIHDKYVLALAGSEARFWWTGPGHLFPPPQKLRNDVVSALQQSCNPSQGRSLGDITHSDPEATRMFVEVLQHLRSSWAWLMTLVHPTPSGSLSRSSTIRQLDDPFPAARIKLIRGSKRAGADSKMPRPHLLPQVLCALRYYATCGMGGGCVSARVSRFHAVDSQALCCVAA